MNDQIEFRTGVIAPVECYKEAWAIIKPHFWILFAITVVGMLIGGATLYILLGGMVCGIFLCYLEAIDGLEPKLDTLFKGMKYILPGLLVTAVFVVPTMIVIGVVYVPLLLAAMAGSHMNTEELYALLIGTFAVELVLTVLMVCLHTLLLFSFPLIIDKELSGWSAIKLSARAVWHNLQGVAGLWAVGFVVSLAGYLLFCVGIYLAIPLILGGTAVAYRKVFPGSVVGRFESSGAG